MMRALMTKTLFVLFVAAVMTGCKIAVIVPSGGDLISSNPAHSCAEENVCEFEINAGQLPFTESFTAHPKPAHEFEKWSDGSDFLCGNSTDPTCTVNINDGAFGVLLTALFDSGYVMPIFKDVGIDTDGDGVRNELDEDDDNDGIFDVDDACPFNSDLSCSGDTIAVNGKVWYQPNFFIGSTWDDINAVCAGGICDGLVNGYNLTGWAWATASDMQALMAYYGAIDGGESTPAVDSFFAAGWRETNSAYNIPLISAVATVRLAGWISDPPYHSIGVGFCPTGILGTACWDYSTDLVVNEFTGASYLAELYGPPGVFFYYPPNP